MSTLSITQLPLAPNPLQQSLTQLELQPQPSAQRRSTTFKSTTQGVWARTYPLWTAWPLRVTKEEVEAMGVDLAKGDQVSVEEVLRRWDPVDTVSEGNNGLNVVTSGHRSKPRPELLGVSESAIRASLPHLDVGDAVALCNGSEPESSTSQARDDLVNILSGRQVLVSKELGENGPVYGPWSTRYCGHQFGSWAGQLGDGRATSLLETTTPDGGRMEIQLKGAGRTPFSRTADGLAVLRSSVREFLGCEAVAALGIPTTRSLALLTQSIEDLPVMRENGAEPSSLMARLAPTFIRIGHFEAMNPDQQARRMTQIYLGGGWLTEDEGGTDGPLGGQGNLEGLRDLAEWCKGVMGFEGKSTADWARDVARRNAEMVGGWQVYGWMHGVLNTDNISILGITIDYGPYAFMDIFDEGHICNHSDPSGLYSYRRQPERVLFALDKLVSALSPLIGYEALHGPASSGWSEGKTKDNVKEWVAKAEETMKGWDEQYWATERQTEQDGWARRFGLKTTQSNDNREIVFDFLTLLHAHSMDFHVSFRTLSTFDVTKTDQPKYSRIFAANMVADATINLPADAVDQAVTETQHWLDLYAQRAVAEKDVCGEDWTKRREAMRSANPRFVLRQWVLEELIANLEKAGTENIQEARRKLARVLDMATNPFGEYEDDGTEEGEERSRLCGLGGKDMLGFQCSCSS